MRLCDLYEDTCEQIGASQTRLSIVVQPDAGPGRGASKVPLQANLASMMSETLCVLHRAFSKRGFNAYTALLVRCKVKRNYLVMLPIRICT